MLTIYDLYKSYINDPEGRRLDSVVVILRKYITRLIINPNTNHYISDILVRQVFNYIHYYFKAFNTQGILINKIIITILYLVIKINKLPIGLNELSKISNVPAGDIFHYLQIVRDNLIPEFKFNYKINYYDYIEKYCKALKLSNYFLKKCYKCIDLLLTNAVPIQSLNPNIISLSIIYFVNKYKLKNHHHNNITFVNLSKISGYSKSSIKDSHKKIKNILN